MKRYTGLVLLLSLMTTGCTGSFNLTRKLHDFHRSQPDKWADELLFLAFGVIIPVYGFTTLADAIVFNSIEFWTGENPIEMVGADGQVNMKYVEVDGQKAEMQFDPETGHITVTAVGSQEQLTTMTLKRLDRGVKILDQNGDLVYRSVVTDDGDFLVYNAGGRLVKNYSAAELASLKTAQ